MARQPLQDMSGEAIDWLKTLDSQVFAALRSGTDDMLLLALEQASERWPSCARLHWLTALVLRDAQAHERALTAIEKAVALDNHDAETAALRAQIYYESGRDAAAMFARARNLTPDDLPLIRGHAGALAAEGRSADALSLLAQTLSDRPGWTDGQNYRATLHRISHAHGPDDAGFAEAVRVEPRNIALWLGWFHWMAKSKRWSEASMILRDARQACGDMRALTVAQFFLDAESGAADDRPDLFEAIDKGDDPGLSLARVRHALRCGLPDKAEAVALDQLAKPGAALFWPYLSLAWRLLDDDRAAWLDRPDQLVRTIDLGLNNGEISELAETLRALHTAVAPYPDQSVRGGTQTDRPLLFRHEPIMRRVRSAIEAGIDDYITALPAPDAKHPLLGQPRGEIRFAGSWSVRLAGEGYHSAHTHPAGWISSALHIVLPQSPAPAAPSAGCLRLGAPPPELDLNLPHYCDIEPAVGRLILFPSTLWHGTVPFEDGERLSIAFDIAPPRR